MALLNLRAYVNPAGVTFDATKLDRLYAEDMLQVRGMQDGSITPRIEALQFGSAGDVIFEREAADILALRRTTSPQELRLYNTFTNTNNYERLSFKAQTAGNYIIASEALGTGTVRNIEFQGGQVLAPDGSAASPSISFTSDPDTGFRRNGSGIVVFVSNGVDTLLIQSGLVKMLGTSILRIDGGSLQFGNGGDLTLTRDAANIFAQRNSTNAQEFRLYNTFTDASNYERLSFVSQTGAAYLIKSEALGTGTVRDIALMGANIGIGTSSQFGSGSGVVGIANVTTAPTTNPTGGGVLWTEGGALKYRGSSGTVTTIAVA